MEAQTPSFGRALFAPSRPHMAVSSVASTCALGASVWIVSIARLDYKGDVGAKKSYLYLKWTPLQMIDG